MEEKWWIPRSTRTESLYILLYKFTYPMCRQRTLTLIANSSNAINYCCVKLCGVSATHLQSDSEVCWMICACCCCVIISVLWNNCQACEKTCYQRTVIEQCRCSDAYFPPSNASAFNHVLVPVCSASNITQGRTRNTETFSYSFNTMQSVGLLISLQ